MIQAGKNIVSVDDPLHKVNLEYLFHAVKNPKPEVHNLIQQLRTLLTISPDRYRTIKKQLPYVVCGIFNPPIRRTENFAWINHFILDIDHLSQKEIRPDNLKANLQGDSRIKLMFNSPSNDGLKVFFQLKERCSDPVKFTYFYRAFAESFARQYQLEQVIDKRTSDVTRACFISEDNSVYYNDSADTIEMNSFINFGNYEEIKAIKDIFAEDRAKEMESEVQKSPGKQELTEDKLIAIKKIINPNIRIKPPKNILVPPEMNSAMEKISKRFAELQIKIEKVTDINYGKQVRFGLEDKWAELNIFYGIKGHTVVISPKNGFHEDLAKLGQQIVCELLIPQHG